MKRILIHGFPSLDNYGTGMMGLITIDRLRRQLGEPIEVEVDFFERTSASEIQSELGVDSDQVRLTRHKGNGSWRPRKLIDRIKRIARMHVDSRMKGYDLIVQLGGDDLSEYYTPDIWFEMLMLRQWGRRAPLLLLGQTIGPFARRANRIAARWAFRNLHIFPRDKWCTNYVRGELGLDRHVVQSTDLAFADLPLQADKTIEENALESYGLTPDEYFTIIVSALQTGGYYTSDREAYIDRYKDMIETLLRSDRLANKKLCLLAHTFTDHYGDEPTYIRAVMERIDPALKDRIVVISDRVLQARARFVLGGGMFTITGRMHPAVSTFQMGKPAITLSYSKKYEGVIGTMLGRSDLIIEANDPVLWDGGVIVDRVVAKVEYVLDNMDRLRTEIRRAIDAQKAVVDDTFDRIGAIVKRNRK